MTHGISDTVLLILGLGFFVLTPVVLIGDWINGIRKEEQEQKRLKSLPSQYD